MARMALGLPKLNAAALDHAVALADRNALDHPDALQLPHSRIDERHAITVGPEQLSQRNRPAWSREQERGESFAGETQTRLSREHGQRWRMDWRSAPSPHGVPLLGGAEPEKPPGRPPEPPTSDAFVRVYRRHETCSWSRKIRAKMRPKLQADMRKEGRAVRWTARLRTERAKVASDPCEDRPGAVVVLGNVTQRCKRAEVERDICFLPEC
jgi:hypothetical protein